MMGRLYSFSHKKAKSFRICYKNTDESLDECRQVQTNADECKRIKKTFLYINGWPSQDECFLIYSRFLRLKHR